jgi:hypothetical protein
MLMSNFSSKTYAGVARGRKAAEKADHEVYVYDIGLGSGFTQDFNELPTVVLHTNGASHPVPHFICYPNGAVTYTEPIVDNTALDWEEMNTLG